jgi:hypothetical protein
MPWISPAKPSRAKPRHLDAGMCHSRKARRLHANGTRVKQDLGGIKPLCTQAQHGAVGQRVCGYTHRGLAGQLRQPGDGGAVSG